MTRFMLISNIYNIVKLIRNHFLLLKKNYTCIDISLTKFCENISCTYKHICLKYNLFHLITACKRNLNIQFVNS